MSFESRTSRREFKRQFTPNQTGPRHGSGMFNIRQPNCELERDNNASHSCPSNLALAPSESPPSTTLTTERLKHMKSKFSHIVLSAALLLSLQANAQESVPPTYPSAASPQQSSANATSSSTKTLPRISVRWGCDSCDQNPKVAPLIEQSYASEAAAKGYSVSPIESAEIVITEYRQRHPAARAMLGIFAGKDKLATKLSFRGKEYPADDYSANAFQGMNSLCESVAQQALAHVLMAIKE